jgi:hypothetical protein
MVSYSITRTQDPALYGLSSRDEQTPGDCSELKGLWMITGGCSSQQHMPAGLALPTPKPAAAWGLAFPLSRCLHCQTQGVIP